MTTHQPAPAELTTAIDHGRARARQLMDQLTNQGHVDQGRHVRAPHLRSPGPRARRTHRQAPGLDQRTVG